jgi:hypothetical protein
MKEIIWVFGTSASGKETFIKAILNDKELQKTFDLDDSKIAISKESLRNLGKLDTSRASILDEVSHLRKSNDVIVIKWQYGDTLLHMPDAIREEVPAYKHTVIKLNVPKDEQVRRLKTKTWWHNEGEEDEFIAEELLLVEKSIAELDDRFTIKELDW